MNAFKSIASNIGLLLAAASVGFAGVYSFTGDEPIAGHAFAMISGECSVKGNINTRGERIFHVPGQRYYNDTVISASHGERWFCSEAEARAAGWRRSKV